MTEVSAEHHELLRRRAAALARVPMKERRRESTPAVVFQLGDERFAIEASCVLQVSVLRELTPLPGAAPPLFGVTHWRGTVLTVLDLRELLGVRVRGLTDLGRIIVVDGGEWLFGIVADAVTDMAELDPARVQPLPDQERGGASLLRGVTEEAVLVLDTSTLLQRFGGAGQRRGTTGRGG